MYSEASSIRTNLEEFCVPLSSLSVNTLVLFLYERLYPTPNINMQWLPSPAQVLLIFSFLREASIFTFLQENVNFTK